MDNKDYLDKLIDLQKVVKRIDYQISELESEKRKEFGSRNFIKETQPIIA